MTGESENNGAPAEGLGGQQARGNTAPSASGANGPQGPAQTVADGRKKVYRIRGTSFEVDPEYDVIKAIGLGAYGLVCSAKNTKDNRFVAIKKVPKLFDDLIDGKRVIRELKVMKHLRRHPNVTNLLKILAPRTENPEEFKAFRDVYVISELMDTDLHLVLRSRQRLSSDHHAYFMYQLVKAVAYVHTAGVIHRDLKPGNLLLNSTCDLKVCDFGLARAGVPLQGSDSVAPDREDQRTQDSRGDGANPTSTMSMGSPQDQGVVNQLHELTDYVITRWYRPPELLLMSPYNHAVDMWSVGCIMAEMILRRALFQGRDYLNQLQLIAEVVDIPKTQDEIRQMMPANGGEAVRYVLRLGASVSETESAAGGQPLDTKTRLMRRLGVDASRSSSATNRAVELISKLLVFNPHKRCTAAEALRHPFFAHLYNEKDIVDFQKEYGPLRTDIWEFDHRDLNERALRELFWGEMVSTTFEVADPAAPTGA